MGRMRKAYKCLAVKPEGNIPLERPGHRWENNIKINLRVWECGLDLSYSG
jgi:hypothetical protein